MENRTDHGILQLTCLIKHINAVIIAAYIDVSIVMDGYTHRPITLDHLLGITEGMVVTIRPHIKVIRTILYMLTIHCDEELVRTSSLRGEGDGVGTIPVVLHLSIHNCSIMGLGPHLTLHVYTTMWVILPLSGLALYLNMVLGPHLGYGCESPCA